MENEESIVHNILTNLKFAFEDLFKIIEKEHHHGNGYNNLLMKSLNDIFIQIRKNNYIETLNKFHVEKDKKQEDYIEYVRILNKKLEDLGKIELNNIQTYSNDIIKMWNLVQEIIQLLDFISNTYIPIYKNNVENINDYKEEKTKKNSFFKRIFGFK